MTSQEHIELLDEATKPIMTLKSYNENSDHRQLIINDLIQKEYLIKRLIELEVQLRDL